MKSDSLDVVSWTTRAEKNRSGKITVSEAFIKILHSVGVTDAFGIVGGGNALFAEKLLRSSINLWHKRHEAGAAFAATEASFASKSPVAVFVTTGPVGRVER